MCSTDGLFMLSRIGTVCSCVRVYISMLHLFTICAIERFEVSFLHMHVSRICAVCMSEELPRSVLFVDTMKCSKCVSTVRVFCL